MLIPSVRIDDNADSTIEFAAAELARYLEPLAGSPLPVGVHEGIPFIYVGTDLEGLAASDVLKRLKEQPADSFALVSQDDNLFIVGRNERSALYGVYAYLESLGARWFFPGDEGELPPSQPLQTSGFDLWETPDFNGRALTYYPYAFNDPNLWVDFAAKQRLNLIFWHTPNLAWWDEHGPTLVPEMRKRGLSWEVGGHHFHELFPASLFMDHPDWFRMVNGKRVQDFNLCPSNAEGLAYLKAEVSAWVARAPGASLYHFWPDDIWGGGWCTCPSCHDLSSSDQSLMVANALAQAAREVQAEARIAYLAYHDTIEPPNRVKPEDNVVLHWAPRERCYAHSFEDTSCPLNRTYYEPLEQLLTIFPAEQSEVFEYYLDGILYRHLMPPFIGLLPADLQAYKSLSLGTIAPLMVNLVAYSSPPPALFTYPKLLWSLDASPEETLSDYAERYLGDRRLLEYFKCLDNVLTEVLRACDFTLPPMTSFWTPTIDNAVILEDYNRRLGNVQDSLEKARALLSRSYWESPPEYRRRLDNEKKTLAYTTHLTQALWNLGKGYKAALEYQREGTNLKRDAAIHFLDLAAEVLDQPSRGDGAPAQVIVRPTIEALVHESKLKGPGDLSEQQRAHARK